MYHAKYIQNNQPTYFTIYSSEPNYTAASVFVDIVKAGSFV